jgi:hypothetical protein
MILTDTVPVNATDFAILQIEMLKAIFSLIANSSNVLSNSSIMAIDIWNASYSALSFGYWVAKSFIGSGGVFDVATQNATAMANFSEVLNFLGKNATSVFGDLEGRRGIAAVLKNSTQLVDQNLSLSLARALNESSRLLHKMLSTLNVSFT